MRCKSLISAALLSVLLSCTQTGTPVSKTLGESPIVSGGKFTSGGGITVAADLRASDGRTLVCGVWAQSKQQSVLSKNRASRVVSNGAIFLGRERVVQNFLFMNEVEPSESYAGQSAGCLLLDRPWSATDSQRTPLIRIPRQLVNQDVDDEGGGQIVFFIDTGRPEAGP